MYRNEARVGAAWLQNTTEKRELYLDVILCATSTESGAINALVLGSVTLTVYTQVSLPLVRLKLFTVVHYYQLRAAAAVAFEAATKQSNR